MTKNQKRTMKAHVERRENARWEKELKSLVEAWAVVESPTGLTLRWLADRDAAFFVANRINAGGPI